ncbi:hypothetical protein KKF84_15155 [Myxococcota bacterium]|nr:hypothetical protein [Myxococcota bacterium]
MTKPIFLFISSLLFSACISDRECEFVGEYRCDGDVIMHCTDKNYRDEPFGTDLSVRRDCGSLGLVCVEGSVSVTNGASCQSPGFECQPGKAFACLGNYLMECTSEGPAYYMDCAYRGYCVDTDLPHGASCAAEPGFCEYDGQRECVDDGVLECENGVWAYKTTCREGTICDLNENGYLACVEESSPQ